MRVGNGSSSTQADPGQRTATAASQPHSEARHPHTSTQVRDRPLAAPPHRPRSGLGSPLLLVPYMHAHDCRAKRRASTAVSYAGVRAWIFVERTATRPRPSWYPRTDQHAPHGTQHTTKVHNCTAPAADTTSLEAASHLVAPDAAALVMPRHDGTIVNTLVSTRMARSHRVTNPLITSPAEQATSTYQQARETRMQI